jgi:hypothetical protein
MTNTTSSATERAPAKKLTAAEKKAEIKRLQAERDAAASAGVKAAISKMLSAFGVVPPTKTKTPTLPPEAHGIGAAIEMFSGVGARLVDLRAAEEPIDKTLREGYRQKFDDWRGWLVDAGALMKSLTDDGAAGALREAHHDEIEFGSTVSYARFHRGALLDITPKMERDLGEVLADHYAPEHPRTLLDPPMRLR